MSVISTSNHCHVNCVLNNLPWPTKKAHPLQNSSNTETHLCHDAITKMQHHACPNIHSRGSFACAYSTTMTFSSFIHKVFPSRLFFLYCTWCLRNTTRVSKSLLFSSMTLYPHNLELFIFATYLYNGMKWWQDTRKRKLDANAMVL